MSCYAGLAALEVVQQRGKIFQEIKDKFANRYVKFFKMQILKEVTTAPFSHPPYQSMCSRTCAPMQ